MMSLLFHATCNIAPQAGGGGSFGSGGSDYDGGDGLGFVIELLVQLAFQHPKIGVPTLIVGVVVMIYGSREGWFRRQQQVIRRSGVKHKLMASKTAAAKLIAVDPNFDEAKFSARVVAAFQRIQDGWCAQDLEPMRAFVSDGILERFALQIAEQKSEGWRQEMKTSFLGMPKLVRFDQGPVFEALHVRVEFRSRISRVSLSSISVVPWATLDRRHFVECWTFLRRRGTRSLAGDGLFELKCPACAAPLELNRTARCTHCHAHVKNGSFDWVLSEITQESAWTEEREADLPGFEAMRTVDPGLSAAALEDRVSVAFWRLAAAEDARAIAPLLGLVDDEARERLEKHLQHGPLLKDRAVGSVRSLGFGTEGAHDFALFEVLWDGLYVQPERKPRNGLGSSRTDAAKRWADLLLIRPVLGLDMATGKTEEELAEARRRRLKRTVIVLRRKQGSKSSIDDALTTSHCRSCGAHDLGSLEPQCAYCSTPRLAPESEWRLGEVLHGGMSEAAAWIAKLRTPQGVSQQHSTADLLRWAASLARSDGSVNSNERRALQSLAVSLGLRLGEVDGALADRSELELRAPESPEQARQWYEELLKVALSDAKLHRSERAFLHKTALRLGMSGADARREFATARLTLWRKSRSLRT